MDVGAAAIARVFGSGGSIRKVEAYGQAEKQRRAYGGMSDLV